MFAEPIPNVTVAVGRDASLPCVINNLGTYKVAWVHVGRQMLLTIHTHIVVKIPRFSVSHDKHKTWLLRIQNVQQEDRGYYMCQVNTIPMISQVGYLQVVVPPNIIDSLSTDSTVAVKEHQNITLTCKAEGYPNPTLMWRRENGQSIPIDRRSKVEKFQGEQLNLTKITRTEMGAYLCIATNGIPPTVSKRIIVDVEFSPTIFLRNQLMGAPAGKNVTLECKIEAHPRAISYWNFNNSIVLATNEKYTSTMIESSYRTNMQLTIRNLQQSDFGTYKCISKNSLGETEGSIRLYEMAQPSAPPTATEIRSGANKDGKQHSTPLPPRRQYTTIWPMAYSPYPKRTERPLLNQREVERPDRNQQGHSAGSAYIIRWSAPQLMVVAVQYILTGPYIPPYVLQHAN
ncbi:lachesin isoform X1 [Fopius arisanus]|uniref:Lachesin isoform X1 n=1 Tax=Fopius arisanus TaxID=64838 RepID=A0A9R1TEY9_9HYME|nr:PREDICTED: lachesin isoform X1 [Fopius arisanus]